MGTGNDVQRLLIGNKVDEVEIRKVSTETIAVVYLAQFIHSSTDSNAA